MTINYMYQLIDCIHYPDQIQEFQQTSTTKLSQASYIFGIN